MAGGQLAEQEGKVFRHDADGRERGKAGAGRMPGKRQRRTDGNHEGAEKVPTGAVHQRGQPVAGAARPVWRGAVPGGRAEPG